MFLNLLVLRCLDIKKTKEFYEKFNISFVLEKHETGPEHYSTQINDLIIELYPAANSDKTRLGFKIEHLKELETDLEVLNVVQRHGKRVVIVSDPDGRKVELEEL